MRISLVKYLCLLCAWLMWSNLHGQIKFFHTYSNAGFDKGEGICQLPDSSYLLVGSSTSYFDGPTQFFIARIDSMGTLLWSKDAGGSEVDNGKRIIAINDEFYAFGTSSSNTNGDFDFQLVKGNINGTILSRNLFPHQGWDFLNDAILLPDSTFILAGYTTNTADGLSDAFYMRVDTLGLVTQSIQSNRLGEDQITSVELLNDSTFLVGGYRFNPDSLLTKAYIKAIKFNGNVLWEKEYGDVGNSQFFNVLATIHGIYGTGAIERVSDSLWQDYYIRLNFDGSIVEQNTGNNQGEKWAKELVHLGGFSYFLAVETDDDYTFGAGTDVIYYSFNETLDFQGTAASVQVDLTDQHGQVIPTSDGGFIAIGSTEKYGEGELSVYLVKAFKNDYPDMTLPNGYSLVGLTDNELLSSLIYPNPVRDYLNLSFEQPQVGTVKVLTVSGKKVYSGNFDGLTQKIDLSELNSGMYVLQILTENGRGVHRLVKE